jgi:hypothetical protein
VARKAGRIGMIQESLPFYSQRWKLGRDGFVLDLERGLFSPSDYEVVHVRGHAEARAFVETHHYSASWPSAIEVFELRHHELLVGVAVFSEPGGPKVLPKWFPGHEETSVELGRLVLLDEVSFNAETWMLTRAFEVLWRTGYTGIVSFSDPMPRSLRSGRVIFPGHLGTTYKAKGAIYTGRTAREKVWTFDDGTVFPSRCRTKIRAYAAGKPPDTCSGWEYAARRLVQYGAPPFAFEHGDPGAASWCDAALARLARVARHPGQHRYLWARRGGARRDLERNLERLRVPPLPYPKLDEEQVRARLCARLPSLDGETPVEPPLGHLQRQAA